MDVQKFTLVLECIKNINLLDGSYNQLPDFIKQVENILPTIQEFEASHKNILMDYLKGRIVGKCREALHRQGNPANWEQIKEILKNNFGEKENSNALMDKLKMCRMNDTIEKYYSQITELLSRIQNRNLLFGDNLYSTTALNRIALQIFRENLPEPTRTMIFARDPSNIEEAYKVIREAGHLHYSAIKYRNSRYNDFRQHNEQNTLTNRGNSMFGPNYNRSNNNNQSGNYQRQTNQSGNYERKGTQPVNSQRHNNQSGNYQRQNGQSGNYHRRNDNYLGNFNRSNNVGPNQPNYQGHNGQSGNFYRRNDNHWENYNGRNGTGSNQSRNFNRSQDVVPMEIGSSNINFSTEALDNFPI